MDYQGQMVEQLIIDRGLTNTMNTVKIIVETLILLMLLGCASAAKTQNMTYFGRVSGKYHPALKNEVGVAKTTGRSEISNEAFGNALKESLRRKKLFSNSGRYQLEVKILKVTQPPGRFNMTVTTHVKYTLVDSTTNKIVFKETIVATHTAFTTDALTSMKRLRLANEGSAKRNIAQLLNQLSKL